MDSRHCFANQAVEAQSCRPALMQLLWSLSGVLGIDFVQHCFGSIVMHPSPPQGQYGRDP